MNERKIEIVKLNLPASVIAYIIRAALLKKKVLLVSDKKYLYNYYRKFFYYITKNSFELDLSFTTKILYKLKTKEFQESVVIGEDKEIIRDIDKVINLKKLTFERNIVHEFFNSVDILPSLIILQNEIHKIYKISRKILKIAKEHQLCELLNHDEIHYLLKDISTDKLQSDLLTLLIEIVENYFEVNIPWSLKLILKKMEKKENISLIF